MNKFFDYRQNNSGGSFDINDRVTINVIIEAPSASVADAIAQEKGLYFDGAGDCPCCGNRWSEAYGEGDSVPSIYGEPIEGRIKHWDLADADPSVHIYYLDGRKVSY